MAKVKHILIVVGTRPNFIKVTQFKKIASKYFSHLTITILHTGQHFDDNMSKVFFDQFNLHPDVFLNAESGRPASQIASIIQKLDAYVAGNRPDIILSPGDVNSTLATSIVANKNSIPLGHIESGLRSEDLGMPEEHNRILADNLANHLFVTEPSGLNNIANEELAGKVHYVGNTMIDTMVAFQNEIDEAAYYNSLGLKSQDYILLTMHRPATVDNEKGVLFVKSLITEMLQKRDVVFPAHPRTINKMKEFGVFEELKGLKGLHFLPPLGYFQFQNLVKNAFCCVTDSGGIQEETTFAQVPCLTLRPNTERPITIEKGTNTLLSNDVALVINYLDSIANGSYKKGEIPELWDGKATRRILEALA